MSLFSWFHDASDQQTHSREAKIKDQLNQSMWPTAHVRKSLIDNDAQPRISDLKRISAADKKQINQMKEQLVKGS